MNAPAITLARPLLVSTCDRRADTTGSIADYDDLTEALAAYNRATLGDHTEQLAVLRLAARRCGWPAGSSQSVVYWATRRLATYRAAVGQ